VAFVGYVNRGDRRRVAFGDVVPDPDTRKNLSRRPCERNRAFVIARLFALAKGRRLDQRAADINVCKRAGQTGTDESAANDNDVMLLWGGHRQREISELKGSTSAGHQRFDVLNRFNNVACYQFASVSGYDGVVFNTYTNSGKTRIGVL